MPGFAWLLGGVVACRLVLVLVGELVGVGDQPPKP